ncbi:MAG: ABC transporter permease [Candidatus Nanoarchaeia archaeon]
MNKILPLIGAILKSFIRNKTYILLLIVAPLILISAIFLSFNSEGLQKIPVGITGSANQFNITELSSVFNYLIINQFDNVDECMASLKRYEQYACIEVIQRENIIIKLYYDNTREPVIWEIIERIDSTIMLLEEVQSRRDVYSFLGEFNEVYERVGVYQSRMSSVARDIDLYIVEIDNTKNQLRQSRTELSTTLDGMDSDISQAKSSRQVIGNKKNEMYSESMNTLSNIDASTYYFNDSSAGYSIRSKTDDLRDEINDYNSDTNAQLYVLDSRIYSYELASSRGRGYVNEIGAGINKLDNTKQSLYTYKNEILETNQEISKIKQDMDLLRGLNVDSLVSPITMEGTPTYIPDYTSPSAPNQTGEEQVQEIMKGINMISLQTIYPTVLFLILLFLALLISNFICLSEINSSSHLRIRLVKKVFFSEILAIFISSLIIVVIPLILILLTGDFLFKINVLDNMFQVLVILVASCSVFILMGMLLAYLIRKESITLLLTTFLLVFFIFLSGVLLPFERMSFVSNFMAVNFPTYLGLSAFNKTVFYEQSIFATYYTEIMIVWILILFALVALVKKTRD